MRVPTKQLVGTTKQITPLYTESINMLNGLLDEEVDRYLEEHPKLVSLFEVDVAEAVTSYVMH